MSAKRRKRSSADGHAAGETQAEIRFVPKRRDATDSRAESPTADFDEAGYVLYEDHIAWVIVPREAYERLDQVYRAMQASTWGEFLDRLPSDERERVLAMMDETAGPDIVPWSEERLRESMAGGELAPEECIRRDDPFDVNRVPGFCEGDWPDWPASDGVLYSKYDGVCALTYERFGVQESGFLHTFQHISDDRIDEAERWLRSIGASVERRGAPGSGPPPGEGPGA